MIRVFIALIFFSLSVAAEELESRSIKKGAMLFSPDEKDIFILDKSRIFFVSYDDPENPLFVNIHDKNKKIVFKTKYENIENIDEILQLNPIFDHKAIYKKATTYQTINNDFKFNLLASYGYERVDISDLSEIYDANLENANANKFDIKVTFPSELGVNFALNLNYLNITWDNTENEYKFNTVNLGPQLEFPIQVFGFNPSINLGAELSVISEIKTAGIKDKYTKSLWHMGIANDVETVFGKFNFELFYRLHDVLFKESSRSLETANKEYTLSSFGISFGHRWDFNL